MSSDVPQKRKISFKAKNGHPSNVEELQPPKVYGPRRPVPDEIFKNSKGNGKTWEELQSDDGVALYLGDSDCSEIPDLLFPGKSQTGNSRQNALRFSQEFEATGNAAFAMASMRISLRYGHEIEPAVRKWWLDGAGKYLDSSDPVSMDSSFGLNLGKGRVSLKTAVDRSLLMRSIGANLATLETKLGFDRTTARLLLYARDFECESSSYHMGRRNFNILCTQVEGLRAGVAHPDFFYHWYMLPNAETAKRYLQTFIGAYLNPELKGAVIRKMKLLKYWDVV